MSETYSYNLHNIIKIQSEAALPELEPFLVDKPVVNPDILVRIAKRDANPTTEIAEDGSKVRHLYYRELLGSLGFEATIEVNGKTTITASQLLKLSPHVLYTNLVEPVLRWLFVEKGYALVHGATIAIDNKAYMITARTDTGKTTTLLKILGHQRRNGDKAAFISDDMTILSPDGVVMTYPKPLTISHHTVRAVNTKSLTAKENLALSFQSRIHSRSGRKVAFAMGRSSLPMATINALVQFVVPPPKYSVKRLLPTAKLLGAAKLEGLFIIERGDEKDMEMDHEEALNILLSNCEDAYGFPPYNDIKEFLYLPNGVDLRVKEQAIIRSAFENLPATLVRSKSLDWWCRIPPFVDAEVAEACTCTDNRPRVRVENLPSESVRVFNHGTD